MNFYRILIPKEIEFYIKTLALLFIIAGVFGFITAQQFPSEAGVAVGNVEEELSFIKEMGPWSVFLVIALNNSIKAFFMMLLGVLWGVIPVLFILLNGYAIGIVISVAMTGTGFIPIILSVLPHGILEIPAILITAGYGVWLGEMFSKKLKNKKNVFSIHIKNVSNKFIKVILPILIVAAFIETFITNLIF